MRFACVGLLLLSLAFGVVPVALRPALSAAAQTPAGPTPRWLHAALWTGEEMLIWGGFAEAGGPRGNIPVEDGWRYKPSSDTWRPISRVGAPSPRAEFTVVWTGQEMIVWGGFAGGVDLNDGAAYRPATDTWRLLPSEGAPAARWGHSAVWSGREMIVWGGENAAGFMADGARLNPEAGTWTPLPLSGAPGQRARHNAVWTGSDMIVWGGFDRTRPGPFNNGGRYSPAADAWTPVSEIGAPPVRSVQAVWTGREMIVWSADGGARYDPGADGWRQVSREGAVQSDNIVWTGSEMLVWSGTNRGGRYNPESDTWRPISSSGAPSSRVGFSEVWTGRELIIWGGEQAGNAGVADDGGKYRLDSDTWTRFGFTPTFDCERFLADLTLPDGTRVQPGETLDKAWRLSNCGDTTWDGFRAVRLSGRFGPVTFDVPTTRPGDSAELRVRAQAPGQPGCYRATYRLEGPRGRFGGGFFVEIIVVGDAPDLSPGDSVPSLQQLIVPMQSLGPAWCDTSLPEHLGDESSTVRYRNEREYGAPREATFDLDRVPGPADGADPDEGLTLAELLADPDAAVALVGLLSGSPSERVTELDLDVLMGDGRAIKVLRVSESDRYTALHYAFRVGNIVAFVEIRAGLGEDIQADALRLARLQEERLREAFPRTEEDPSMGCPLDFGDCE